MSNSSNNLTFGEGVLGFLGIAALIAVLVLIAGVFFQVIVWNLGVVGLAAALGYTVGKISLGVAIGGIFVAMRLRYILHGSSPLGDEVARNIKSRQA